MNELQKAKKMEKDLIGLRRRLHKMPELHADLPKTTAIVTEELRKLQIPFREIPGGGIVAEIGASTIGASSSGAFVPGSSALNPYKANSSMAAISALNPPVTDPAAAGSPGTAPSRRKKCVLLRADMDALPIREESGLPFAAENGNMHACGHDMHTAMLLGAARILKAEEDRLPVQVRLVFQADEEGVTGAAKLIEAGVLEDPVPAAALGLHILPGAYPAGSFSCLPGPANSSVTRFHLRIRGKSAHGAEPYKGRDPLRTAVQIYTAFNELIGRETDPRACAVLTCAYLNAGDADTYNVVPPEAVLGGGIRTFDNELAAFLRGRMEEISRAVSAADRTDCTIEYPFILPACINDKVCSRLVNRAAAEAGMKNLELLPRLVSDDFALFSNRIPACYVWLAAGGPEEAYRGSELHAPNACFNEEALVYGTALLVGFVQQFGSPHIL